MLSRNLLRTSARAAGSATRATLPRTTAPAGAAFLHNNNNPLNNADNKDKKHPSPPPGAFARTDDSITVEYPEEDKMPASAPVQGRGGFHMKRTLASFSLEGRVGVVTGGARGLGLVMGQGMVISGANLAIVDMNSKLLPLPFVELLPSSVQSSPSLRRAVFAHCDRASLHSTDFSLCFSPLCMTCAFNSLINSHLYLRIQDAP